MIALAMQCVVRCVFVTCRQTKLTPLQPPKLYPSTLSTTTYLARRLLAVEEIVARSQIIDEFCS
jgi:hypothetical protein